MYEAVQVTIYPARNWIDVYSLDIVKNNSAITTTRGENFYSTVPDSFFKIDPRSRRGKPESKGVYGLEWNEVEKIDIERIVFMTIFEGR